MGALRLSIYEVIDYMFYIICTHLRNLHPPSLFRAIVLPSAGLATKGTRSDITSCALLLYE